MKMRAIPGRNGTFSMKSGKLFFGGGQQIPDADLPRLWDPFYRVDKARNRSDGGTGLGLTIVRAAVLAHGGTCEVENRSGGVRFRVSLPCGK